MMVEALEARAIDLMFNRGGHVRGLLRALQRLNQRLEQAVAAAEAIYGSEASADPYRGMYISHDEVARLLVRLSSADILEASANSAQPLRSADDSPRLSAIQRGFGLSGLEADILLIALAPELDQGYERLYAFLQNDLTKRRPSVALALDLLYPTLDARLAARQHFAPDSQLLRYQFLQLVDDPADHQPPLLSKYLKIDARIADYLLGVNDLDPRVLPYARNGIVPSTLGDLHLAEDVKRRLLKLGHELDSRSCGLMLYFQGSYGVGKHTTAAALCGELGIGLLAIDVEQLLAASDGSFGPTLRLMLREAMLQQAALYLDAFDALLGDDRRAQRELLIRELAGIRGMIFLAGNTAWEPADLPADLSFVRVELPRPLYAERLQLWARALGNDAVGVPSIDIEALADKFRFSAGQIRDVAATARNLARWRATDGQITMDDLTAACRLQSNQKLATLSRKVTANYTWNDIVLPADRLQQLREICNHVQYRALVYDEWGFDGKLSLGKGLNVLFAGPSGTGKTMAADIIARELGLDMYKIDLSMVVSKYIGETEKNLARIFAEAETSNAILFFDEADALFGKRSEVRDSHDRYANVEIAYLLQRMEEYEGVVILATNLRKNMDDAFVRRLHATVEFPFPDADDRLRIWESIWPDAVPRDASVDLLFLAQRFEITGGNIRNVALAAAFLAAADGRIVTMDHLVRATRREFQKIGKVVGSEFGQYTNFID
jgi:SpoVK/Ycf46/Vps4 family AAA+-type ATPase